MGGLNNGNKDLFPMLSELFSVLTNVNLKCIRVSGPEIRFQYSIHIFLLKGRTWGVGSLSQYMGIYVFWNTSRRARSHFDCDQSKILGPLKTAKYMRVVASTETCSHYACFIQITYSR